MSVPLTQSFGPTPAVKPCSRPCYKCRREQSEDVSPHDGPWLKPCDVYSMLRTESRRRAMSSPCHLVTWLLRTRPSSPAPPACTLPRVHPSASLSPPSTKLLERASSANQCHAMRRRDGRAHRAESRLLRRPRLWRLPCRHPTHSLRKPNS